MTRSALLNGAIPYNHIHAAVSRCVDQNQLIFISYKLAAAARSPATLSTEEPGHVLCDGGAVLEGAIESAQDNAEAAKERHLLADPHEPTGESHRHGRFCRRGGGGGRERAKQRVSGTREVSVRVRWERL